MKNYSNLNLPPRLLETEEQVTIDEANRHLEWLSNISRERIEVVLSYFNIDAARNPDYLFKDLGAKAASVLNTDEFSYTIDGKRQLTDAGISLAIDIGLLIAQLLLDVFPHVRWSIGNEERDEGIIYRSPILRGLWKEDASPILDSIRVTRRVLWGHVGSNAWLELFYRWLESATMASNDPDEAEAASPIDAGPDFMSAVFNALDRGIATLSDGEPLIPFLIWASTDGSWIRFFDEEDLTDAVSDARDVIGALPEDILRTSCWCTMGTSPTMMFSTMRSFLKERKSQQTLECSSCSGIPFLMIERHCRLSGIRHW